MVDAYSSRTTVEQYAGGCVGASVGWEITIVRGVDHGMHVARSIYTVGPVPLADPVECPTSPNGLHDNSRWRVVRYRGYRYRLAHLLENHPRFERDTRTYPQGAAPGPWPIFQGVQVVFPRFRPGAGAQAALRRAPAHVRKSGPSIAASQSQPETQRLTPTSLHITLPLASTRECSCTLLPDMRSVIDQALPLPTCAHTENGRHACHGVTSSQAPPLCGVKST